MTRERLKTAPIQVPAGSRRLLKWALIVTTVIELAFLVPFIYRLIH
jgi:hypothetical protein